MRNTTRALCALLFVLATLCAVEASADQILVVQLRTDFQPGIDFDTVRVEIVRTDTIPPVLVDTVYHGVDPLADYRGPGAPVLERLVEGSELRLTTTLLQDMIPVARRVARVRMTPHLHWPWSQKAGEPGPRVVTLSLTKDQPPVRAEMSVELLIDADASGGLSTGDVIRTTVTIPGHPDIQQGSAYGQIVPAGTGLLAGTVKTTHGVVLLGNEPGSDRVYVELGPVPPQELAMLRFDSVVAPVIESQGVLAVAPPQQKGYLTLTDDPFTPLRPEDTAKSRLEGGAGTEGTELEEAVEICATPDCGEPPVEKFAGGKVDATLFVKGVRAIRAAQDMIRPLFQDVIDKLAKAGTDSPQIAGLLAAIEEQAIGLGGQIRRLEETVTRIERRDIERALVGGEDLASLKRPLAQGGSLERVIAVAAGCITWMPPSSAKKAKKAKKALAKARAFFEDGAFKRAYKSAAKAYRRCARRKKD